MFYGMKEIRKCPIKLSWEYLCLESKTDWKTEPHEWEPEPLLVNFNCDCYFHLSRHWEFCGSLHVILKKAVRDSSVRNKSVGVVFGPVFKSLFGKATCHVRVLGFQLAPLSNLTLIFNLRNKGDPCIWIPVYPDPVSGLLGTGGVDLSLVWLIFK